MTNTSVLSALTEKSLKFCESTDVMWDRLVVKCLLHKHDLNSDPQPPLQSWVRWQWASVVLVLREGGDLWTPAAHWQPA